MINSWPVSVSAHSLLNENNSCHSAYNYQCFISYYTLSQHHIFFITFETHPDSGISPFPTLVSSYTHTSYLKCALAINLTHLERVMSHFKPHPILFCISGLTVACSPVVQAAGVRFPADADICSSDSCLKCRSRVFRPVLSARKRSQCYNQSKDVWLSPLS